jgi:thiol-disulfide isomerase/thioredoxin
MLHRVFLLIVSIVPGLFCFSQETKIFGTVPGADGFEIRLLTYANQMTHQIKVSDRTYIKEGGGFELTLNTIETVPAFLEVENYSILFYIEPGETYQLICDSINPGKDYLPFYNKNPLQVNTISEPDPFLNSLISYFDYLYDDFVENNFNNIYRNHKAFIINDFTTLADSLYGNYRNEFLQTYIHYRIASLKMSVSHLDRGENFKIYLEDQPVYYDNPEYMNFFHQFFDHYISGFNNRFIKRDDLYATINSQYSYPAMLDSLGKDSMLRNEVIRELVLIKTLMELFHNRDFSSANIIHMLKQVNERSKFERHRAIAASAVYQLTRFEQGFPAPYFNLPGLDGDSLSLPEFEGKPLYLSFMTTWSYACLEEFELLNKLYAEFGNSIHFVTISLDKDLEVISRFKEDKQYDWEFLYNGSNYDLILDYDIKTFPMFVLIDRNGKIFQYAAYKPSELIKESFKQVLKK